MDTRDRKRPIEEEEAKPPRLRRIDLAVISSNRKREITEKIDKKIAHLESISADENALMIVKTVHDLMLFFCSHLSNHVAAMFFQRPNSPEQRLALDVLSGAGGGLEKLALLEIEKCIPKHEWDAFAARVKIVNDARAYPSSHNRRINIYAGGAGDFKKSCSEEYFISQSPPMPKTNMFAGAVLAYVDPVKNVRVTRKKKKLEETL